MAYYTSLFVLCLTTGGLSAPADEPVRVDLPVYDQPLAASAKAAEPFESVNYGAPSSGQSLGGTLEPENINSPVLSPDAPPAGTVNLQGGKGWFADPPYKLEGALLETEGLGSKVLSTKDNLHNVVAGLFQPKPIVDTIKEEEKYGNNGDKFYNAGRAIVGGAEGVSNFVNSALEIPGTIIRKIARIASDKLNNLGGKLIGLQ